MIYEWAEIFYNFRSKTFLYKKYKHSKVSSRLIFMCLYFDNKFCQKKLNTELETLDD